MRLVCPNCEAKYEVPDDAVPDTGRDVQCTNCGHSWYQMRGRTGAAPFVAPAPAADAAAAVEPVAEPVPKPEAVAAVPTSPVEQAAGQDAVETEGVLDAGEDAVVKAAAPDPAPLEELTLSEAAPGPVPEDSTTDKAMAEAEAVALQEAEPEAELAPVTDPEQAVGFAPADEHEPMVDVTAGLDLATEADHTQVPGPVPVAEDAAKPEATVTAGETSADPVTAEVTPEPVLEAVPDVVPETAAVAASDATDDDTPAPAPEYAVDDSVLAILREEAEREANARRADALESQTDLGIDAAMPRRAAALAAEAEAKPSARRDLLPDVEEINSTLRPSELQADADGAPDFVAPPPEAPRGFRSGFLSLMTVAILAAALYLVAPRLAVMVPSLAGPLESYVSIIDSLRLGLDGMMRSATVMISDG